MRHFIRFHLIKVLVGVVALQLLIFLWLEKRNHPPKVVRDTVEMVEGRSTEIRVMTNDTDKDEDELMLHEIGQPNKGKAEIVDNKIKYVPEKTFFGTDSLWYTVNDGKKTSRQGFVHITVNENMPPNPQRDEISMFPWSEAEIYALENDEDREDDSIFVKDFTQPKHGAVAYEKGRFIYRLSDPKVKTDSFTYSVADLKSTSEIAIVKISIIQPPTTRFANDSYYGSIKNYRVLNVENWDMKNEKGNISIGIPRRNVRRTQNGRLGEYALTNKNFKGAYTITMKAKSIEDLQENQRADFGIILNYEDDMNYTMAFFNSYQSQDGATGIYKFENGVRTAIVFEGVGIVDNKFHNIKITRRGNKVSVFLDNKLLMAATDPILGKPGPVGFGTVNDRAYFDDIVVSWR